MQTLFLKRSAKPSFSHFLLICVVVSFVLVACGKKEEAAPQSAGVVMPVGVISVKSTSVPITAEAVAQTEGAKEVEIRPRVGGILLKRMYNEGASVKAGQTMFLIDPAPYQIALQQAKAAYLAQQARVEQTAREGMQIPPPRGSNRPTLRIYARTSSGFPTLE